VNLKAIIFDKDGTLFDIQRSWSDWCNIFIRKFCDKYKIETEKLAQALNFDLKLNVFKKESIFVHGSIDEVIDRVHTVFPTIGKEKIHHSLFEDIADAKQFPLTDLDKLFVQLKDFKLGLVTNDSENNARQHLSQHNLIKYFDRIFGYDSGYGAKPESGQLLAFCNQMFLEPNEVLMVGDSRYDLIAAKNINMSCLGVLSGTASREELKEYTPHLIDSIDTLYPWLNKI